MMLKTTKASAELNLSQVSLANGSFNPSGSEDRSVFDLTATVEIMDDECEPVEIGNVHAFVLTPCEGDFVMTCDDISQSVYDASEFISAEEDREKQHPILDFAIRYLFVDSIVLAPEHRGKDLGLSTLREVINTFGYGCDACVLLPCPIGAKTDEARELGQAKLKAHYARAGFEEIRDTGYMALDLTTTMNEEFLRKPWE